MESCGFCHDVFLLVRMVERLLNVHIGRWREDGGRGQNALAK